MRTAPPSPSASSLKVDMADLKHNSVSGLGQKARSAVIWNTGFNLFRDLLQFGTMLVLVRLLDVAAYGQFGLVTGVIGFISVFSFNNFIAHTLQVSDEADVHYQDHFTAGAVMAVTMFGTTNLVAGALHWFESYAPVAILVHVMSITFLLGWPCELRVKMLERQFDWKRLRLLHASGLVVSTLLAVGMAAAGAGVYALLVPGITVTLPFIIDLFFVQRWRPKWTWSWSNYRNAWRFGVTRMGSGTAILGRQLMESAVLAKALGFAQLGVLNRAAGLAHMLCMKFASQLVYAIYPILTRLDPDSGNAAHMNGLLLRLIAWVAVPIAVVLSVLALPVVHALYGRQWDGVIPLLPWAMLSGLLLTLSQTVSSLLLARQQPARCLAADILAFAGTVSMLFLVLPKGLVAYLIGLSAVHMIVFSLNSLWLCRLKALSPIGILAALAPPMAGASTAWALCHLGCDALGFELSGFTHAIIFGICFGLFYMMTLRLFFARLLADMIHYFPIRDFLRKILWIPHA